jgi:hypothetical protein
MYFSFRITRTLISMNTCSKPYPKEHLRKLDRQILKIVDVNVAYHWKHKRPHCRREHRLPLKSTHALPLQAQNVVKSYGIHSHALPLQAQNVVKSYGIHSHGESNSRPEVLLKLL